MVGYHNSSWCHSPEELESSCHENSEPQIWRILLYQLQKVWAFSIMWDGYMMSWDSTGRTEKQQSLLRIVSFQSGCELSTSKIQSGNRFHCTVASGQQHGNRYEQDVTFLATEPNEVLRLSPGSSGWTVNKQTFNHLTLLIAWENFITDTNKPV
jgi:hypothetical protein